MTCCLCDYDDSPNHCDSCTRELLTPEKIEEHRLAFAKKRARDLMKASAKARYGPKSIPAKGPKEIA